MNKFKLIRILSWLTGIQPISIRYESNSVKYSPVRFLNPYGIWSVASFCFVVFCLSSYIYGSVDSSEYKPSLHHQPPDSMSQFPPDENMRGFEDNPPPNGASGPSSVVIFALNIYDISTRLTNLTMRLLIWIFFPRIPQLIRYVEMICKETQGPLNKRSPNEIVILVAMIASQMLRQGFALSESFKSTKGPPGRQESKIGVAFILSSISMNLSAIIAEGLPLDIVCFILVTCIAIVTQNIENICNKSENKSVGERFIGTKTEHLSIICLRTNTTKALWSPVSVPAKRRSKNNNKALRYWAKDSITTDNSMKGAEEVERLVANYFKWFKFWMRDSEKLVGFVTLVLFFNFIVSLCMSFFVAITSTQDHGFADTFSARNIVRVIMNLVQMMALGNAAHSLKESSVQLTETIIKNQWRATFKQEPNLILNEIRNNSEEKDISHIVGFMIISPIQISALGYFSVTRSTVTNIANVIVTYLVILLQFRSPNEQVQPPPPDY